MASFNYMLPLAALVLMCLHANGATTRRNVMHFIVDDLRPAMHDAYHQQYMITPTFDRLASEGNHIRESGQPHIVTLPQQFRNGGWVTLGGGKTFHFNLPPYFDDLGERGSWSSEVQPYFPFREYVGSFDMASCNYDNSSNIGMCLIEGDEYNEIYDYRLMNHTIDTLRKVTAPPYNTSTPWYVMAGFRRPHRVFKVMKRFWDMYPDEKAFATAKHKTRSPSQPLIAFHNGGFSLPNTSDYQGTPDKPWPNDIQQIARKAYASAVTQTDAYIGHVLDALDASGQADNTIVVLHADHGWQLGEHGLWDKQTEFELATRVPLIIKVPWKTASVGQHTAAFVELVDLHPTIAALAGLSDYQIPTNLPPSIHVQAVGQDVSAVFDDPQVAEAKPGKNASFSQWPVCTTDASKSCMACTGPPSSRARIQAMGYSIRTNEWRYTVWLPFNRTMYIGDFAAEPIAIELYNHSASSPFDFDLDGEVENAASDPNNAAVAATLFAELRKQYTWPANWLAQSRSAMVHGQLNDDFNLGFYPYTGTPQFGPNATLD